MADDNVRTTVEHEGSPGWVVPAVVVLGILALVGIAHGLEGPGVMHKIVKKT